MTDKRYFELVEGSSSKFWEVRVDGTTHTVRYGKIGTPGQEKTKSFPSAEAAKKDADKLVAEKTKKGYSEVVTSAAPSASLDEKALAEQLAMLDRDGSPQAHLVFGDWLQSVGHPWGTLIALHHAIATAPNATKRGELEKEERALLQSAGASILGELATAARPTRFAWSYGFVKEAIIGSPPEKVVLGERLRELFARPAGRKLEKLTLHCQPARFTPHSDWDMSMDDVIAPWDDAIDALANAPATLGHVAFGDPPPTAASAYVAAPDFAKLSAAMPKLERLEVQGKGDAKLDTLAFPEMKELVLRLAHVENHDLDGLTKAKLPKIERLTIWVGGMSYCTLDDIYEADWDADEDESRYPASYPATDLERMEVYDTNTDVTPAAIRAFLDASWPSTLEHLGLGSLDTSADFLRQIAEGGLTAKLKSLDLSGGTLNDAMAQTLVDLRDRFAHLESLDLSRNVLTKAGIDAIQKALPKARCDKQRTENVPELIFRYVATME